MPREIEGELAAKDVRLAVVVARFNSFITSRLLDAALDTFRRQGGNLDGVVVVRVPGSFELGVTAKKLAASGKYDAVICLGCVVQGDTKHYDCVVDAAAGGVAQAGLDTGVPVIFGVLTCSTLEQAIDRAGGKMGNAGSSAALAAIEMANLIKKI
jgi:6,7-dimethyl-8-ribityllumazine synthase